MSDKPHPTEHSSARGNQHAIHVDLRRGRSVRLADHAALRDAVIASRDEKRKAGVRVLRNKA